jgi:hypothetical protein
VREKLEDVFVEGRYEEGVEAVDKMIYLAPRGEVGGCECPEGFDMGTNDGEIWCVCWEKEGGVWEAGCMGERLS